eukprot:TRINITY_DN22753_c0_g1_i1.p1 TRINITY_DN22753_c0_g1~~TRINITY_DN22753_c0_g1_i1.p1  ORF type:complete len:411 (+),score=66.35 TRINITY_DN22753_c0_g1_i1:145-1377(+)
MSSISSSIVPVTVGSTALMISWFVLPAVASHLVLYAEKRSYRKSLPWIGLVIASCILCVILSLGGTHSPVSADYARLGLVMVPFFVCDAVLRLVFRLDVSASWFFLHAFANALVVAFSWESTFYSFLNPYDALSVPPATPSMTADWFASVAPPGSALGGHPIGQAVAAALVDDARVVSWAHAVAVMIHVYHVVAYFPKLTMMDVVHHATNAFFIGIIAICWPFGRLTPTVDFFMCGLPGGVDYLMLGLVQVGWLNRLTEKRVNAWLNLAVRYPGIMLGLYCALLSRIRLPIFADPASAAAAASIAGPMALDAPISAGALLHSSGWWQARDVVALPLLIIVFFLHGGNAQYFCDRVVRNTAIRVTAARSGGPDPRSRPMRTEMEALPRQQAEAASPVNPKPASWRMRAKAE